MSQHLPENSVTSFHTRVLHIVDGRVVVLGADIRTPLLSGRTNHLNDCTSY